MHPRARVVVAADYTYQLSLPLADPYEKVLLLTSANEIALEECGQAPVMWRNFGLFQTNPGQNPLRT